MLGLCVRSGVVGVFLWFALMYDNSQIILRLTTHRFPHTCASLALQVNLRPGGVRSNSVTAQTLAQIDAELSARAEAAGVSTGGHNDDDTGSHTLDVFS